MVKSVICINIEVSFMKSLLLMFSLVVSSICFAQKTGSIIGIVLDGESYDEPLMYANVSIEGTALKTTSDTDGLLFKHM